MFELQMKVRKSWVAVGEFNDAEEAKGCAFDARFDYRVVNEYGDLISFTNKTADSWQDLI